MHLSAVLSTELMPENALAKISKHDKAFKFEVEKPYRPVQVKEMPDLNLLKKLEEHLKVCVKVVCLN